MISPCPCGCEMPTLDGREIDVERILRLVDNLATAAFGERCFRLGSWSGFWEAGCRLTSDDENPSWQPGAGISVEESRRREVEQDFPLKSADAEQGMRTCEGCAEERRAAR